MKKITAIIMLFMIVACTPSSEIVYKNVENGVVFIANEKDDNGNIGTGFFIDKNLIMTNYHVVADGNKIIIRMKDSNFLWEAKVLSYSEDHDIALLEIKEWDKFTSKESWKPLQFFDSRLLNVGEPVHALGHPWGLAWTFSSGVLSAKDRTAPNSSSVLFLQVDARIYQGNSGGPLFNKNGKVVGVNAQMLEGKGGSYGFVIPSQYVQKVLYDLKKYKESKTLRLGILLDYTENRENILIKEVAKDSAAEKCDIRENDVIIGLQTQQSLNYIKIKNMVDFIKNIITLNMDQNLINMMIRRSDEITEIQCKL